ncbi:MAG: hypothetical protein U1F36_05320 [Planctomycetota bacterium]
MTGIHRPNAVTKVIAGRGLALIAVLLSLAFLLSMTLPFVLSMGHGEQRVRGMVDETQVDWAAKSARDLLLQTAALGATAIDPTPMTDGRDEYPAQLAIPEAFVPVEGQGVDRNVLQGEVEDLSRRLEIASATPLCYANLLGLFARTRVKAKLDATELEVDGDLSHFPDSGYLYVNREVIRYGQKLGSSFTQLERGQWVELGYFPATLFPDYEIAEETAVFDLRCVLAVLLGIDFDGNSSTFHVLGSVGELGRLATLGLPAFSAEEIDRLSRQMSGTQLRETSARFGRAERVFAIDLDEAQRPRILAVKSSVALGAGRLVRIRSRDGKLVEYDLVADALPRGQTGVYDYGSGDHVALVRPLTQPFDPVDTLIEPLVQAPVNINTADLELCAALFANLRPPAPGRQRDGDHQQVAMPPSISPSFAHELAQILCTMRGDGGLDREAAPAGVEIRPIDGWEDVCKRFVPLLVGDEGADPNGTRARRLLAMAVYDAMQLGCPRSLEAGTVPVAFHSGQLVHYRASASRQRANGREVARREYTGTALALPSRQLAFGAATQETLDEALRLDRRSPYWQTGPINTSALAPAHLNDVPVTHTPAHLLATLFPDAGFGNPRYPDRSGTEGVLRPQPATTPLTLPDNAYQRDSFLNAQNPEGRDLRKEGVYHGQNSGPHAGKTQTQKPSFDHSRIVFPMTGPGGLTVAHAVSFWVRLDATGPQALYDLARADGVPERNRIHVEIREGKLVFEVIDEAGIDPDPGVSKYAPERSAGTWEVALQDLNFQSGMWYHVSLTAHGTRPGQMALFIDGVPHGEPKMRTYLSTALQTYKPQSGQFLRESERFVDVRVESTDGFPARGILRIGLELLEYTQKDSNSFRCKFDDSSGGRRARAAMHEFQVEIPRDEKGNPREDLLKTINGDLDATVPDHPAGAAVELYGYSIPVYPATALQPGSATLPESIGPFAVARPINSSGTRPIVIATNRNPITIGTGFDTNWTGDIELGDPVPSKTFPPGAASNEIASAFPQSGGYALLVQRRIQFRLNTLDPGQTSVPADVGGVEIIRFESRSGTKLSNVTRAATIPGLTLQGDANEFFKANSNRQFVLEWDPRLRVPNTQITFNELPLYMCFVVPISIPFGGIGINDRSTLVEWVQLRAKSGDDTDTEWVRYNAIVERRWIVRAEQQAFDSLRYALTTQNRLEAVGLDQGNGVVDPITLELDPWKAPIDDGVRRIGYIEQIELQNPCIYAARVALAFRGDTFRGLGDPSMATSSHAHGASTPILPVHRMEFGWQEYGLGAPRAGRGDRIALVQGTVRDDASGTPQVEWHTVNWAVRHYPYDQLDTESTQVRQAGQGRELLGNFPFQLVAFQDEVRNAFLGAAGPSRSPENLQDSRLLDRMVKFPSGELPAIDAEECTFGESIFNDAAAARGLLDEVEMVQRRALVHPLDQQLQEQAQSFYLRPNAVVTATGPMVNARPKQWPTYGKFDELPQEGGLLAIDGEICAYSAFDPATGLVTLAKNGRGLLGTQVRAHDEGALIEYLDHRPCGILTSGVSERADEIPLQSMLGFPAAGGTVLLGTELAHYTWRTSNNSLGMPKWRDPEKQETKGLLRGRYGTTPQSVPSGSPVILFPFRYWDRQHERAEDPELAPLQISFEPGPVFFDGFGWRTEEENALVKLRCLARVDERAPFDADPAQQPDLLLFEKGEIEGKPNPVQRHGQRFEARFEQVYRPGCFDGTSFLAQDWKRAITIKWFVGSYDGETRILEERVTAR